ncbi:hypothetical protein H0H87_010369 [Tephrocybe sp. NHM501043]|nr:hypothetical protein H0H87_010369 [Tephrocybe sp. NHM501043]
MVFLAALLTLTALAAKVHAHGYVPQIKIGNQYIAGWDVTKGESFAFSWDSLSDYAQDPYTTPQPLRVVRGTKLDSGFISDVTSKDITCSIGNSALPPIQQDVYSDGVWASDVLAKSNFTYTVKIPSKIAAGSYLLRHENLALHAASSQGGAQFYPVCVQLTVTGGGSLNPSGLSFPGTYKATDPGILFNAYQGDAANKV